MSNSAISLLITLLQSYSGYTRAEFVSFLGYKNVNKGLRSLDSWVQKGWGSVFLIEQLKLSYPYWEQLISDTFENTIKLRERAREQQYLESFQPYIQAETERTIPSQIAFYSIVGVHNLRITKLTNAQAADAPYLKTFICEHYARTKGFLPFLGNIISYVVVVDLDTANRYSVNGTYLHVLEKPPARITAGVKL